MHELFVEIRNLPTYAAYACAAGAGVCAFGLGTIWAARKLATGARKTVAVSLVGAMLIGGMVVVGTDDAGTKPGTNGVNQVEGETNAVTQVEGGTNQMKNVELKMGNGVRAGSILHSPLSTLHSITDEDIALGWRVASVSSNVLAAATFTMPTNAPVWESALASGRGWGAWRIPLDGWHFTYGDDGWTNGFAWVEGYFRSRFNSRANEIRLLSERLTLCPAAHWSRYNLAASRAWSATNDVDGLVVTFENAAVGDDPTKIASVQMELFPRTGEVALRYDLVNVGDVTYTAGLVIDGTNHFVEVGAGTREVVFRRVHPYDWDMDGIPNSIDDTPREPSPNTGYNQTDAWAMAAFPDNAAEIATLGYAAWAAARAADPNRRLVGLHISSPNNAWPVCLTFGDLQVMCDGNEEIVFAIDCGAHYPFSISGDGELEFLTLHGAVDDAQPCFAYGYPYERSAGDVVAHLESPGSGWIVRTAEVSVDGLDGSHFFPGDSKIVTAVVTNCHEDAYIDCTWKGGNDISFSDTHSLTTQITWNGSGSVTWTTNSVELVTTYVGDIAVTNTYYICVGAQSDPVATFSASCSPVQFLNDGIGGDRPERVYKLSLDLLAGHGDGGVVTLVCDGPTGTRFYHDQERRNPVTDDDPIGLYTPLSGEFGSSATAYMTSTNLGRATVRAVLSGDGMSYATNLPFQVIEPIRRLVNAERLNGGTQVVNPSRLVYGTNAILKASVNLAAGDAFSPTNGVFVPVSGPGCIVSQWSSGSDWYASIVATSDKGEFIVAAKFNDDAIQPKFVLPVVRQRVMPLRFFVSEPTVKDRDNAWNEADLLPLAQQVNEIFSQVGITFNVTSVSNHVGNGNLWDVVVYERRLLETRWEEIEVEEETSQFTQLLSRHVDGCINVFLVGSVRFFENLKGDGAFALCRPQGVLLPRGLDGYTLAHELGHSLGLDDIYMGLVRTSQNIVTTIDFSEERQIIAKKHFGDGSHDWGMETGSGFYERSDTLGKIASNLLMFGVQIEGQNAGIDIPAHTVWGMPAETTDTNRAKFINVGAKKLEDEK